MFDFQQVKRFISAIEKKSPVPQEILDKAGPAPSIFDKAAKQGMDLAEVASKYKEYVESGAVEKVGILKSAFFITSISWKDWDLHWI